jgi:hypothetical protein
MVAVKKFITRDWSSAIQMLNALRYDYNNLLLITSGGKEHQRLGLAPDVILIKAWNSPSRNRKGEYKTYEEKRREEEKEAKKQNAKRRDRKRNGEGGG